MKTLLIANACFLAGALLQGGIGILFFNPSKAVWAFFIQCLWIFSSATLAIVMESDKGLMVSWILAGLFALFFVFSFRSWRKNK